MRPRAIHLLHVALALGLVIVAGEARAQQMAPGGQSPNDLAAAYDSANALFKEGRYQEAAKKFHALFADQGGRKASVALALAQSERYSGNFSTALYYYAFAGREYAGRDDADAGMWRAVIKEHIAALAGMLVPVQVSLAVEGGEVRGQTLCGVEVDGQVPVRLDPATLRLSLGPLSTGDEQRLQPLLESLSRGWLTGVETPASDPAPCPGAPPLPAEARLIMSRTRAHPVKVDRQVAGKPRAATFTVTFEELQRPGPRVALAELPASVILEPTSDSMNAAPQSVRGSLTPLVGRDQAQYPLLWKASTGIPAGRYQASISVPNLVASLPQQPIELLPGESQVLQVKLTPVSPPRPFYKRFWFFAVVGAAAAVGAGIAFAKLNASPSAPNPGSLNWTINVP
jgi:hypothetical protein